MPQRIHFQELSFFSRVTQPAITCSKLTTETLEQVVNFEYI